MSLFNLFSKPKWQSPNELVRLTAVQTGHETELLNLLPQIVAHDTSLKVRKAALSRITDPEQLRHITDHNDQQEIQKLAQKKRIQLIIKANDITDINQITDSESLLEIASKSQVPAMRTEAIKKINQQGALGNLLLNEKDNQVQQYILTKLTQKSTLQRIAEPIKKKNKHLYHQIQNKLNQNIQNEPDQTALLLCQKLESVVHQHNTVNLEALEKQWLTIHKQISPALTQRFNGAFAAAKMILDPSHREQFLNKQKEQRAQAQLTELQKLAAQSAHSSLNQLQTQVDKYQNHDITNLPEVAQKDFEHALSQLIEARDLLFQKQKVPESVTQTYDQLQKVLNLEIAQPNQLTRLKKQWSKAVQGVHPSASFKQLSAQFDDGILKLAEKIETSAKKRDEAAQQLLALIEPALKEIKDGHLAQAKTITNQMAQLKQKAGFQHPNIRKNKYKIDGVWVQLKELRQWQKWINDKVRQDIIDELTSLIGTATHPDAVLKKLKESNERWYTLEDMEKLEGDKFPSRNQKMWQQFRTVSKALFEPTQPFFEKRTEQQENYLNDISTLIKEMEQIDLDNTSERDLARTTRHAIKQLKSLEKLPPKQRGKIAKKLRASIDRIDGKLKSFYRESEDKKRHLIEQAQALHEEDNLEAAINQAKALQNQWKQAGIVKQYTERKLWKQFRKANDTLFAKRKAVHQEKNKAIKAQQIKAQDLLDDFLNTIKKAKDENSINQLKGQLTTQWNSLTTHTKALDISYQSVLKTADQMIHNLHKAETLKQLDRYKNLDTNCLLGNDTDMKLWSAEELNQVQHRIQGSFDDTLCHDWMIQSEFLTGLETPASQMKARMAYQVQVLSERMSGEKIKSVNAQATELLKNWYLMPKEQTFVDKNKKRINKNIKALEKLI